MRTFQLAVLSVGIALCGPAAAQEITKEAVPGITNLARLETTVACAGAITPESVPAIKEMGFASIINLRLASENGARIEEHQAAADAAGLRYFHVPFSGSAPEDAAATRFLDAITSPGAEPAFIHCAGGGRAATMWLIKRLAVDHWDVDRAVAEAAALGQTNSTLRQWAVDFAAAHRR